MKFKFTKEANKRIVTALRVGLAVGMFSHGTKVVKNNWDSIKSFNYSMPFSEYKKTSDDPLNNVYEIIIPEKINTVEDAFDQLDEIHKLKNQSSNKKQGNMFKFIFGDMPFEELLGYKTDDFSQDSDRVLLARMLLGEAQDCSKIEKIAIAHTAINRANDGKKWNGETLKEAILKPFQYSAFNKEYNKKLKNPLAYDEEEFRICLKLSKEILNGKYPDPTNGSKFYLNPNHPIFHAKKGKKLPSWSKKLKEVKIANNSGTKIYHRFYK